VTLLLPIRELSAMAWLRQHVDSALNALKIQAAIVRVSTWSLRSVDLLIC
jgi:hypothetical protein